MTPAAAATPASWPALVAPLLDEPLVAVQWFQPGGRWSAPLRHVARRAAGRRRVEDGLPAMALLIVTETRVSVRGVELSYALPDRMRIMEPLGEWPRDQVTGTVRSVTVSHEATGLLATPHQRVELDLRRVELATPDGPLVADLPDRDRTTTAVCKALRLTPGVAPWRRLLGRG